MSKGFVNLLFMDLARSLLAGTKNISSPLLSDSEMVPKLKSKSNKLVSNFPTCFFLLRKKSSLCISSLDFLGFPRISTVVKNLTNIVKKKCQNERKLLFLAEFQSTYYVPSNEDRRQCMQAGHALPISSLAYKRTTFSDVIHFFSEMPS